MTTRFARLLSILAVAAALGGCATAGRDASPLADAFAIQGIDVSKYQGDIDWEAVHRSGVGFVWIKATEGGDNFDPKFQQNWAGAKAAGIARGAYHFAYWCRPMAEQVAWFKAHVPRDPDALPPVLDVEWNGQSRTCPQRVSRSKALAEMQVMLGELERWYGKRPVIYTSVDFHRDVLEGEMTAYPIWVRSVKYEPSVKYGNRKWHFWQHTAEGRIPGIKGFVDRNAFYGTGKDWVNWLTEAETAVASQ